VAVVLVTGASTGLGVDIAAAMAQRFDTVYGASRRGTAPEGVVPVQLDVTDPAARARALDAIGTPDILVNNAGIMFIAPFEDTPEEELRRLFETNFFGPLELVRAVLPGMRERGSGRIINVTSLGGMFAIPFNSPYSSSKHALGAVTRALRGEVAPFGIHVTEVLPGNFKTELHANSPVPAYSEAYVDRVAPRRQKLVTRETPTDYTPVIEAVLEAATSPNPPARILAAFPEQLAQFQPIADMVESIEQFYESRR
jgi:NAD(P)-dependent dehydrogenase (short-subunit alcohol dehydrogenase family)